METLTISLSKRQSIFHIAILLLLIALPLSYFIITFFTSEEIFERKNIAVELVMLLAIIMFSETLIGEFFFLRLKHPKIIFTDEGILFDEYVQGMVKWKEVAHINFGKKVMMRKPSEKYSSIVVVLKNKASVKFHGFLKKNLNQYHIDIDTKLFKENVNDEIERIMAFISVHCDRYKRYKVPHQTRFVFE